MTDYPMSLLSLSLVMLCSRNCSPVEVGVRERRRWGIGGVTFDTKKWLHFLEGLNSAVPSPVWSPGQPSIIHGILSSFDDNSVFIHFAL